MSGNTKTTELWTMDASQWLNSKDNQLPSSFLAYMTGRAPELVLEYLERAAVDPFPQELVEGLRARLRKAAQCACGSEAVRRESDSDDLGRAWVDLYCEACGAHLDRRRVTS